MNSAIRACNNSSSTSISILPELIDSARIIWDALFKSREKKTSDVRYRVLVLPLDFLDSMAWDVVAAAALLGVTMLKLPYKASSGSVNAEGRNMRIGLAAAIGASGFYLFLTGIAISFIWPFGAISGGLYNVLFGGIAALGGLLLLAISIVLFLNSSLAPVSYFAVVVGLYAVVGAYAMVSYGLTKEPLVSALGYLSFAVTAFLSVPATHSDNKWLRWLFAVFAFLFALAWVIQAAQFTYGHLAPPPPT